jgi:hypothetical protein
MRTRTHEDMDMDMETRHGQWRHGIKILGSSEVLRKSNRKRKPRRFSIIRLPFAHRPNGSLSFVNWSVY